MCVMCTHAREYSHSAISSRDSIVRFCIGGKVIVVHSKSDRGSKDNCLGYKGEKDGRWVFMLVYSISQLVVHCLVTARVKHQLENF